MRMLAWINLLAPNGWGTQVLHDVGIDRLFIDARACSRSAGGWLDGQPSAVIIALVYGYIPFLILPLVRRARPDRPAADRGGARSRREPVQRVRARDAAALEGRASSPAACSIALPMFGDYYTPDLVSASTKTSLIGNQIDQFTRQGSEKVDGRGADAPARRSFLLVLMFYYLRTTRQATAVAEA